MITQERLRELFDYRADGALIKKVRRRGNRVGAALGSPSARYVNAVVDGRLYLLHRLVFLFHHGFWPETVDHINRDTMDNRIENLRAATTAENARNRKVDRRNKTGVKNIRRDPRTGRFRVVMQIDGKQRSLGTFDTIEDAAQRATDLRNQLFGAFARHG